MENPYEQNIQFKKACEEMKSKAAYFQSQQIESSSSEEEDDDANNARLLKETFSKYSEESSNLNKVREFLQDLLTSGAIICLICIESVKRNDQVWSCRDCYCMLHLQCIQKWSKDSLYHQLPNAEENKNIPKKWSCPKCRCDYLPSEMPSEYNCFCGKVANPEYNSWNIPHSCGKQCSKKINPQCGHFCILLCHPGPCPPCPQTVMIKCCCSKSKAQSRRCGNKEWLCNGICGKKLQCGIHFCDELCHKGLCQPCKKESQQKCKCGSFITSRPCHESIWQCEKKCNKLLDCKNHTCQLVCHSGTCPSCPDSGSRLCPCGKNSIILPCTENISPCGDTCNKFLECEVHKCTQRCHYGDCGKCLQMQVVKCRCGLRGKSVPCGKEFICDIKCKLRRDCGRHYCNKKCCSGNCPPCEMVCGRTLNCRNHKCSSICHSGPCFPCRSLVEVTCNCGSTKVVVPCGKKKSTISPRCSDYCKLPADCHHPSRHKHKCHFGSCPPCRLKCEKKLSCTHICPAKCHSAVLTKVEKKKIIEGPWDLLNAYEHTLCNKPCPPCLMQIPVTCIGGHETCDTPCYMALPISCGRPCGRVLSCGNHSCLIECHNVENPDDLIKSSNSCQTCLEICSKPRKEGCSHACLKPCHPENCKRCMQHLKMKCHCGISVLYLICDEWVSADENQKISLLCCTNRCPKEASCGHRCNLLCHPGLCSSQETCKKKVTLRCPCKRRKEDFQCYLLLGKMVLCDNDCLKQKEKNEADEQQKAKEKAAKEKEIRDKEMQDYLKKFESKKKKKKRSVQYDDDNKSKYLPNLLILLVAFVITIIGMILYFNF